ncbi:hypothetical protein P167DRAFT_257272 [Morchella conica CCBAS932]|uniref:Uncharacterized protein n=1 Tax=Morchella conica CCBAS932 TaxID=1392247 RepID=A0A3N4KM54_9PEZI|nr:hypothetical protein P167DRAFT_257272 [Morchella conica CCBAS932]
MVSFHSQSFPIRRATLGKSTHLPPHYFTCVLPVFLLDHIHHSTPLPVRSYSFACSSPPPRPQTTITTTIFPPPLASTSYSRSRPIPNIPSNLLSYHHL